MVDIVGMTIEVILRPFNIESLRLGFFVVFLQLLLDMVPLMQILHNTDLKTHMYMKTSKKCFVKFFLAP